MKFFYFLLVFSEFSHCRRVVVTTWDGDGFRSATLNAYNSLNSGNSRMGSLVEGLSTCERLQCDTTVGYGGSPDESGETTLDALLIDGPGHRMAAVAQLRRVRDAARVAWAVMNHTQHTMIVGEQATRFALQMGFKEENLTTPASLLMMDVWRRNNCQPNFWKNVNPTPTKSCGPYQPASATDNLEKMVLSNRIIDRFHHDTIGMVVIDDSGEVSAGTSTNGARYKHRNE
ncbi:unnamed protein product, partial [Mesorhabditis spiculigera]